MFGVVDEAVEYFGLGVYPFDSVFVAIVEEAKVGPEEIAGEEGEYLILLEHREQ